MTALPLSLPQVDPKQIKSTNSNSKEVDDWLDNLPYLAATETALEIAQRLHSLNHSDLSVGQRLKLMELFHAAYQRLHESLISAQADQSAHQRTNETIEAGGNLLYEIATGYKLVINGVLESRYRLGKNKDATLAIVRAMGYLSLLLLQHYQAYKEAQKALWQDIVVLYRYAEREELLLEEVPTSAKGNTQTTILAVFKQIAFLRASDPYRLPPGTVWDVFRYLGVHEKKIQLQQSIDEAAKAGILILDLDNDNSRDKDGPDNTHYWLNGRALVKTLTLDLEHIQSGKDPQKVGFTAHITGAETLQLGIRLLNLWARTPQRVMPRFTGSGTTSVVVGLGDIHDQMLTCLNGVAANSSAIPCSQLNRSTGGQALQCIKTRQTKLWVGQIAAVGTLTSDGKSNWLPGIIRWLVQLEGEEVRFGIQFIGDRVNPVAIHPSGSDYQESNTQLALCVELQHKGQTLQTLIAPQGIFQAGGHLKIDDGKNSTTIRCLRVIENIGKLVRFSYQPI